MESPARHPDKRRPTSVTPSRTSKIWRPALVLGTVVVLAATSLAGVIIGISIFSSSSFHTAGEIAAHTLVFIASSISIVYVIFHTVVALNDKPIGVSRAPEQIYHSSCIIIAFLAALSWMVAMVASAIVLSKTSACAQGGRDCILQVIDIVGSTLAFISAGIVWGSLRSCLDPFQTPRILPIPRMLISRVSSVGDFSLERNGLSSEDKYESHHKEVKHSSRMVAVPRQQRMTEIKASKQLGQGWTNLPQKTSPPKKEAAWAGFCPLLPERRTVRGLGEGLATRVEDRSLEQKNTSRTTSETSLSKSLSSYTSISNPSSEDSVSKPIVSINNPPRRPPRSTIRSTKLPSPPTPARLRYLPQITDPQQEWNSWKASSLAKVHQVRENDSKYRKPPQAPNPPCVRKPLPKIALAQVPVSSRANNGVEFPLEEQKGEECKRQIDNSISRSRSSSTTKSLVRLPSNESEKMNASSTLDLPSKDHTVYRSNTAASTDTRPDSTVFMEAVKVEFVKPVEHENRARYERSEKVASFKGLILGDTSPELGMFWEG